MGRLGNISRPCVSLVSVRRRLCRSTFGRILLEGAGRRRSRVVDYIDPPQILPEISRPIGYKRTLASTRRNQLVGRWLFALAKKWPKRSMSPTCRRPRRRTNQPFGAKAIYPVWVLLWRWRSWFGRFSRLRPAHMLLRKAYSLDPPAAPETTDTFFESPIDFYSPSGAPSSRRCRGQQFLALYRRRFVQRTNRLHAAVFSRSRILLRHRYDGASSEGSTPPTNIICDTIGKYTIALEARCAI